MCDITEYVDRNIIIQATFNSKPLNNSQKSRLIDDISLAILDHHNVRSVNVKHYFSTKLTII